MKIFGIIILLAVFSCCKTLTENKSKCHGSYKTISKALNRPASSRNIVEHVYRDSIFPSNDLAKFCCLECVIASGPNNAQLFAKRLSSYPKPLKIDTSNIGKLENVKLLQLSWLNLSNFNKGISSLKKIENLFLEVGFLDSVPNEIFLLSNLEVLSFRLNNLKTLPHSIIKLNRLKVLDLTNNSFFIIPPELFALDSLEVVALGNPEGVEGDKNNAPFECHANKIDYLKEMDNLIKLLSKPRVRKVTIQVETKNIKSQIYKILNEKKLAKKITILLPIRKKVKKVMIRPQLRRICNPAE